MRTIVDPAKISSPGKERPRVVLDSSVALRSLIVFLTQPATPERLIDAEDILLLIRAHGPPRCWMELRLGPAAFDWPSRRFHFVEIWTSTAHTPFAPTQFRLATPLSHESF